MIIDQSWCNKAYQAMVSKFPTTDLDVVHEQAQQRLLEACSQQFDFENPQALIGFCLRFFEPRVRAALKRRRRSATVSLEVDPPDHRPPPSHDPEEKSDWEKLEAAMAELSEDERALVIAYHFDGLSDNEIAQKLEQIDGPVPERIRRRVQRSRQSIQGRLRDLMADVSLTSGINLSL